MSTPRRPVWCTAASGGVEPHICPSHPSLQPIEQRGRRFAQGQAVAFGGGEWGLGGEGVHLEALAGEGAGGAGQLPGVGDQQHGSTGVVLAQPGGGAGGVLPGGAGAGVAGDAAGGDTELHETLGGGAGVARHIGRQRGVAAELGGSAAGGGGGDGVAAAEQHHHRSGRGGRRRGQLAVQPATEQSSGGGAVDGAEDQGEQQGQRCGAGPGELPPPGEGQAQGSRQGQQQGGGVDHAEQQLAQAEPDQWRRGAGLPLHQEGISSREAAMPAR